MSLRKSAIIFYFMLFFVSGAVAQDSLPFTPDQKNSSATLHEPWLAPVMGYVPSNDALRLGAYAGNLLWNRAGAYVAIEKGFGSQYFTNIYGLTFTLSRHVYLWGGMDLFTSRGVVNSLKGSRKEIGAGIVPWKELAVNVGWSKSVGLTFTVGWNVPLFVKVGE